MTENYPVIKHKTRFILMLNVNLCDNKTKRYQQKLHNIHNRYSKCPLFAATLLRQCFAALLMTCWSRRSHSSVMRCCNSCTVRIFL